MAVAHTTRSRRREQWRPTRSAGAGVILVDGALAAYVGKADRQLLVFLPEDEPTRAAPSRARSARTLFRLATAEGDRAGMLVGEVDGIDVAAHPLAPFLLEAGFVRRATGLQAAPPARLSGVPPTPDGGLNHRGHRDHNGTHA